MINDKQKEAYTVNSIKTGEFLAALRKAAGYTQQEVADYLNLTNKTISKWESGNDLPEIGILPTVATLYGVTVDELLAGRRLEKTDNPDGTKDGILQNHSKWLMKTSKHLYTTALTVLWISSFSGLMLFWGLHYGVKKDWLFITCSVIWILAELLGAFLCFRALSYKYSSISAECPDMAPDCKKAMFWQGMGFLFPILFTVCSLLPFFFFNTISGAISGLLVEATPGLNEFLQEFSSVGGMDTIVNTMLQSNLRLTWVGYFVFALPVVALLASFVWGILYFLLQRILLKEKTARYAVVLLVAALFFFTGLTFIGQQYKRSHSTEAVVYEKKEDFERDVKIYLHLYESYRAYGEMSTAQRIGDSSYANGESTPWPDVTADSKVIDNTYLDTALKGEHPEYQRIIGIDADTLTIYKKADSETLIQMHNRWNSYQAIACTVALIGLWCYLLPTKKRLG